MHYKDGTEAKVGDLVKGTCYNTKGVIVGVMLGITPGSNSCNCRVGLLVTKGMGDLRIPYGRSPGSNGPEDQGSPSVMEVRTHDGSFIVHNEGTARKDGGVLMPESSLLVGHKVDYSQCDHLELVHRPE